MIFEDRAEEEAWVRAMVELEEERGPLFAGGFGGGVIASRNGVRRRFLGLLVERAAQASCVERDAAFQCHEPPGSYGLCWQPFIGKDGWTMNCTKLPAHDGDCGREEP